MDRATRGVPVKRWVALVAALLLLNVSLTFTSVWPTLAVRATARLSPEAAALVAGLALVWHWRRRPVPRAAERVLAALWVLLIVAHYAEVSTRSLYGRSVSLYWDLKLLPDVGAMFAYVAQPRILLATASAVVVGPLLLFLPLRWAIGCVNRACDLGPSRRLLLAGSLALLISAAVLGAVNADLAQHVVSRPVSASIAEEAVEFLNEATGRTRRPVPPAPDLHSDLAHVRGADVVLLFVESYGVTSWERPEFRHSLLPARAALTAAIAETGRSVVTALVESTTFGGESWLAHISLLSGTEVRDQDMNRRLMAERRDTLVTTFRRAGYRTLGILPGLHAPWPEGQFYGFDRIYTSRDLAYEGPPFGWWDVTDQFVLARMDEFVAGTPPGTPTFVFLPTISTHTPFTPVPPYQPDWSRLLTPAPYDDDDLEKAYEVTPDWSNLGPDYARALAYMHQTLTGYLRRQAGRDVVMVILGDHQPPALVSGEGASWNVPVHVIASRAVVLERLLARGFREGLEPGGAAVARMDTLMPILLDAFGNTGPSRASGAPRATSRGE